MAFLTLTQDEVALLRFTCDLSFCEEGPLYFIEKEQRIPVDMESAYHNLIAKKVLDPETFRLTDDALNRIAPVVECDARIVHLFANAEGVVEQKNFYLLDNIAVALAGNEQVFALGDDLDLDELCEHFARRLLPRRAFGEKIEFRFSELEFIAFSRLVQSVSPNAAQLRITKDALLMLLGTPPSAVKPRRAAVEIPIRSMRPQARVDKPASAKTESLWQNVLNNLLAKKVFLDVDGDFLLRPALLDFVKRLRGAERHTFMRYDFGDGEWVTRETSFVPTEGGLFFIGADPDESDFGLQHDVLLFDVDKDTLKKVLESSLLSLGEFDPDETMPFVGKLSSL